MVPRKTTAEATISTSSLAGTKERKRYSCRSVVDVFSGPIDPVTNQPLNKSRIWVEGLDFCCAGGGDASGPRRRKRPSFDADDYLIIGFDTEFKTPDAPVERDELKEGKAKYEVLSYQHHCKMRDGREWSGLCCPKPGERMTLGEFIVFALGNGRDVLEAGDLPTSIYLVGHFTRADIPAFSDFKDITDFLANVRNTFISDDAYIPIDITLQDGSKIELKVRLRDTILLTPAQAKSLAAVGELTGHEKVVLDPDPARERWMKQNMDIVRRDHWELFKKYALTDAIICVKFIERVRDAYFEITKNAKIPVTLTSIGVDLLLRNWGDKDARLQRLGKEEITEKRWDKRKGWYIKFKRQVDLEEIHWSLDFVTSCYHGGRNEQFWFGPGFEDRWIDYDLSSAYPTAMSTIGLPDWRRIHVSHDVDDYGAKTLGYACVDFIFPDHIRYPTLPVRTGNGLIFPSSGRSYCSSPEIAVARSLGADIKIRHGVIVPTYDGEPIFGTFIKYCLEQRKRYPKKSFDAFFWKEISNSTYGKTAQGLREKRVYDMRVGENKPLPPSRITNPFFAAYITSFVRGSLGEIMNSLPESVSVFSCTTDGFLTTATSSQIEAAQNGQLCGIFRDARLALTGDKTVLETKHTIRQPLGWRTRGQATLKPGPENPDDQSYHIVLAKSGIYTPPELDTDDLENEMIVNLFFNRDPNQKIRVAAKTGIRDMINYDADLVEKNVEKHLNMEFDWKRRPYAAADGATGHLCFSTIPWRTVNDFKDVRDLWDDYQSGGYKCLKRFSQLNDFLSSAQIRLMTPKGKRAYLRVKGNVSADVSRLRLLICAAWKRSQAGLTYDPKAFSSKQFAQILTDCGVPCARHHVEHGKRRPFTENSCPQTERCKDILAQLKERLPTLRTDLILAETAADAPLAMVDASECYFVSRCLLPVSPSGAETAAVAA